MQTDFENLNDETENDIEVQELDSDVEDWEKPAPILNDESALFSSIDKYIANGFHLFPASPLTHKPMMKDNLERASNDLNQVKSWFTLAYKGANIGLSCAKSGLVVVDVDVKNGGLLLWESIIKEHGDPKTLTARTPSGGLHYIFKAAPNKSYIGKIANGIDIKHNGFVLLFPSISKKNGKQYVWERTGPIEETPTWLAAMIEKNIGEKRKSAFSPSLSTNYIGKLVAQLKTYELDYDEWTKAGMAIHSAIDDDEGLALYLELTNGPSFVEGDNEKAIEKWKTFSKDDNGVGPLTLSYLIRKKGGTVPNPNIEQDKEFFKHNFENQLSLIKEHYEKKDCDFQEDDDGNRMVSWDESRCVSGLNKMGFLFMQDNRNCIGRIVEKNGDKSVTLMPTSIFLENMAPWVYRFVKQTASGAKVEEKNAGSVWVKSKKRNECKGIIFAQHDQEGFFNMYRPLDIPRVSGNPDMILDMVFNSLCAGDNKKFEWLLDWTAHIFQKPFEKGATVPVHITDQGRGKGLYYNGILQKLLGRYMITVQNANEVTATFNLHLANKFLTFLDESSWRGNRAEDGVLKKLIGSPMLSVEEKFGARYELNNYSRYAFGSNSEEAVAVELGNRRYVLIEAFGGDKSNNTAYFNPIWDAVREGTEVYKFYNFLMERDISGFNPFRIIEGNTDGQKAKLSTNGAVASFWYDTLFEDPLPVWKNKGLLCQEVYNYFNEWMQKARHYERGTSKHLFWARTKQLVPSLPASTRARLDGNRANFKYISPQSFAESFCRSLSISMPKNFDASLLEAGDEFDDVCDGNDRDDSNFEF